MPELPDLAETGNKVGLWFRQWWPIIVFGLLGYGGLIETRIVVGNLVDDRADNDLQWLQIRANNGAVINHQGRLDDVEMHITPPAIQAWGAIQNTVKEDHRLLGEHLRQHGRTP